MQRYAYTREDQQTVARWLLANIAIYSTAAVTIMLLASVFHSI